MSHQTRTARRLLWIIVALNVVGVACFSVTTHAHNPLSAQSLEAVTEGSSVLDSIGFTLMMPGIFFGAVAFLCARALALDDSTSRIVWYTVAFVINIIIVRKAGRVLETMQCARDQR